MTQPRVAVLDYGSGNLHSVTRALAALGAQVTLTSDTQACLRADGLVVPGVGAFASCMRGLTEVGGPELITERFARGGSILGICVGHQVLFEAGLEHGVITPGLGLYQGLVARLTGKPLPHMGWNTVSAPAGSRMFAGIADQRFYFVHSYAAHDETGPGTAWTEHAGDRFVAAIERGSAWSTQFHPEKSGPAGARLLSNWLGSLGQAR